MSHLNESFEWVIWLSHMDESYLSAWPLHWQFPPILISEMEYWKASISAALWFFLSPAADGQSDGRINSILIAPAVFQCWKYVYSGLHGLDLRGPTQTVWVPRTGLGGRPTWITGFESSLFLFWSTLKTKFDPSGLPTGLDFSEHKTSSGFNIDGIRLGSIPNSDWQSDAWYWYGTHFVWSPLYVT